MEPIPPSQHEKDESTWHDVVLNIIIQNIQEKGGTYISHQQKHAIKITEPLATMGQGSGQGSDLAVICLCIKDHFISLITFLMSSQA